MASPLLVHSKFVKVVLHPFLDVHSYAFMQAPERETAHSRFHSVSDFVRARSCQSRNTSYLVIGKIRTKNTDQDISCINTFFSIASISRFTRTELVEVLNAEYIVTAKAKGLTKATVIIKHALRNALIPVITVLGPLVVSLLTGSLVVEKVFAVPGLGDLLVTAITTNDLFVISGVSIFYSAFYIGVILLVDILYGIIDPRIRVAGGKA